MKKLLITTAFICLFSLSAQASKDDKIKELIELTNLNDQEELFEQQAIDPILCIFDIPENDKTKIKYKLHDVFKIKETMIDIATPFWKENFTEEELDQILDFYKSDIGKKTIQLMPKMTEYILQQMMIYQQKTAPKLDAIASKLSQRYSQNSESEFKRCMEK